MSLGPRATDARDILGFAGLALVLVLLAVVVGGSLISAFSYSAAGRDRAELREVVREAFADGTLGTIDRRLNDRELGAFQFNDCAILELASNDHGTRIERALSPFGLLKPGQDPTTISACGHLKEVVVDGNGAEYVSSPYHRYLHGGQAVAAELVPRLGVQGTRNLLLTLNQITLLSVVLICLWRLRAGFPTRHLGMAVLATFMLTMSGVSFLDQSLSMGPADLSVHLMLALLVLIDPLRSGRAGYLAVVAAGAVCVAYFEFLTGQIPLAVGLLLLLPAMSLDGNGLVREAILRSIVGIATFLLICAMLFGVKYWITAQVFGPSVWGDIFDRLAMRTALEGFSLVEVFMRLAYRTHHLAFGSVGLGLLYLVVAILAFVFSVFRDLRAPAPEASWRRWRALGFLAGAGAVLTWYIVFSSHTAIHSWFMIRPLGLCCAASMAYLWLLPSERPARA